MNLTAINDWSPGFPFRNLMWGARAWETRNADGSGPWNTGTRDYFRYDEDGYPLESPIQAPGTPDPQAPFTLLPNVCKPGKYVLLHDGEGAFSSLMGTRILSSKPGRVLLQMTHRRGLVEGIVIKRSTLGNHVRNIRIVALEDESSDISRNPFLTEFLDFCRPFHALRFMDWAVTNGSMEEKWSGRKRASFYTMVGVSGNPDTLGPKQPKPFDRMFSGGVAIEVMIQLANTLEIDPWFCIPHRASDEYITEYAKLVRSKLDPRRRVYVEYSNEIWNWGFLQAQWMLKSRRAGDLVEAAGSKAWDDAAKTKGTNHPERIGALFRRTFGLWEREWQGRDRKRLVRVCSVQAGWLDVALRTARWCINHGGADAIAPSAYFGPGKDEYRKWAAAGSALTADEVIADMKLALDREGTGGNYRKMADFAIENGISYMTYEGGQHIQPKDQAVVPYNPALGAAQKHPGMYDLYLQNFRLQQSLGNTLFCQFASISEQGTRWGSWGAKESYSQPLSEAPKMRALLDCNTPKTTA